MLSVNKFSEKASYILENDMMSKFKKPIAVIDLETTGLDIKTARIVSIGIVILSLDGSVKYQNEIRINPCLRIPEASTNVHGITDEDVRDLPCFSEAADRIMKLLTGCDLVGYNIEQYDLPILKREFALAGFSDFGGDAKIIDVKTIYNKAVRGDLSSAVFYYLGRSHKHAHKALADAQATAEVLLSQIEVHKLSSDTESLQSYCQNTNDERIPHAET